MAGFDRDLGRRVIEGDDRAFAELYDQTVRGIHDFIARMVRNRAIAEDLTQSTYIRAFEHRSSVQDPARLRAWLYQIARNLTLNHLSRERPTTDIADAELAAPGQGPEASALATEIAELVWSAAAGLEPRQYEVLDLTVRRGLSSAEVADILGVDRAHGAVLVNRAREALANSVRFLLVARRRRRCDRLDQLVPARLTELTPAQRSTVDHHMRRCEVCRDTAAVLTAPVELFGGIAVIALPPALAAGPGTFLGQRVIFSPPSGQGVEHGTVPAARPGGDVMDPTLVQQPPTLDRAAPWPAPAPATVVGAAAKGSFVKVAAAVAVLGVAVTAVVVLTLGRTHHPQPAASSAPFDYIAAKATELHDDQAAIVSFVRDGVRSDHYDGALRGPIGTLWDGAGNDLDRALLLKGLLDAAGRHGRLVHGTTYGVEVVDGDGHTTYLGPAVAADPSASVVDDVPSAEQHTLTLALITTDAQGQDVSEALGASATADLAAADLTLSYVTNAGTAVARFAEDGRVTTSHVDVTHAQRQVLRFTVVSPDGSTVTRDRQLFDATSADVASVFDPSNRYHVVITTGWVPDSVRRQETANVHAVLTDPSSPDHADAVAHVAAYTFLASSDANTVALAAQQQITARVGSPRITIVGDEADRRAGGPRVFSIDLRKNDLTVDGDRAVGISFNTSHSMYDGALESQVLSSVTGQQVVSADDVLAAAVAQRPSSLVQRLTTLAGAAHRLLADTLPDGSAFSIAAAGQPDDSVTLTREGAGLTVTLGGLARRAAAASADTAWLDGAVVSADHLTDLVRDIETVLANGGHLPIDHTPVYHFTSTPRFYQDLWVFTTDPVDPSAAPLTSHYGIEGDDYVVQSSILRADGRTATFTYTEAAADIAHATRLQLWVPSEDVRSGGSLFEMLSREAYHELQTAGSTVISVVFDDGTTSDPIRFWALDTVNEELTVNGSVVQVPVLNVVGEYDHPGITKPTKAVDNINDPKNGQLVNHLQIVEDPNYPLELGAFQAFLTPSDEQGPTVAEPSSYQSMAAGTVVDALTGVGVAGATVQVAEPGVSATSWPDGGFQLPAFGQRFGAFSVTVTAPGYQPLTTTVDFAAPGALPLSLALTPDPAVRPAVWVDATNVDSTLAALPLSDHSRSLIRAAVADPSVAVLVPGQPTFYALGPIDAWLEANKRTGELYGMLPDGLYGASTLHDFTGAVAGSVSGIVGKGAEYAKQKIGEWLDKAIETPYSEEVAGWGSPIAFYAGHVAGWYDFAAGALDTVGVEIGSGDISICEFHKRTVATAVLLAKGDWRTTAATFTFEQAVGKGSGGTSLPPANKAIDDIAWKAGVISAIKLLGEASKVDWGLADTDC